MWLARQNIAEPHSQSGKIWPMPRRKQYRSMADLCGELIVICSSLEHLRLVDFSADHKHLDAMRGFLFLQRSETSALSSILVIAAL